MGFFIFIFIFLLKNILTHKYAEQTTWSELSGIVKLVRNPDVRSLQHGSDLILTNLQSFKSSLVIPDGRNSACA